MKVIEIGLVSGKVFETETAEVLLYQTHTEIHYRGGTLVKIPNSAIAYMTLRPGKESSACEHCLWNPAQDSKVEEGGDASS